MGEQRLEPQDARRRLRGRNWAIFAVLAAMVLLFYVMTIVRMGGAVR
ncbi:MAG TPA: hypothetical protein VKY65_15465 [Alphaproteobacteria bacterium]|nr:hypothetical protein [Alphaproteobacteria bacterium]